MISFQLEARGISTITLLIANFQLIFSYFELDFCANKDSNEEPESSIPTDTHISSRFTSILDVCTGRWCVCWRAGPDVCYVI
jgi:hypothetical protein